MLRSLPSTYESITVPYWLILYSRVLLLLFIFLISSYWLSLLIAVKLNFILFFTDLCMMWCVWSEWAWLRL